MTKYEYVEFVIDSIMLSGYVNSNDVSDCLRYNFSTAYSYKDFICYSTSGERFMYTITKRPKFLAVKNAVYEKEELEDGRFQFTEVK